MPDQVDQDAPWAWIPPEWRDAGETIADRLGAAADATGGALSSLGLGAPQLGLAASPSLYDAPPIAPFDSALAGGPSSPTIAQPAVDAVSGAAPAVGPPPLAQLPPPIVDGLAGAPGAPQPPEIAASPPLPAPAPPIYPPMPMPVVPPGAPKTPAELDPTSPAAWDAAQNAAIGQLSNLDPIAYAEARAKHDEAAKQSTAGEELRAAIAFRKQAEQDHLDYQHAAAGAQADWAQVVTDAQALAKKHIDPDPRSTMGKIRGVLAAFVGGLVAPYMGGKNVGLEAIQREIEQSVAAQQADIQNEWKGIEARKLGANEKLTLANDLYKAAQTQRLSLWQATINELQQKQNQYDSRGTAAFAVAGAIQGAKAKVNEALLHMQEVFGKQQLEMIETSRKQQQFELDKEIKRKELQVSQQNANTSAYSAETGRLSALNSAQNAKDELDLKVKELAAKGDLAGAERLQKFGVAGITPTDGSDAAVASRATETEMAPLRDSVADTRNVVANIDKILTIRTGGSTKIGNSAEYQQLKSTAAALNFLFKEKFKLKNLTDTDLELLSDVRGFDDPTKFRTFKAGILQARQEVIDELNQKLIAHAVNGRLDLPQLPPSVLSDSEKTTTFAAQNPAPVPFSGWFGGAMTKDVVSRAQVAAVKTKSVDEYAAANPAERDKIYAQLVELSTNAPNEDVRDAARSAIDQIHLGSSVAEPPTGNVATPERSTQ